jgi:hypothetical protein
VFTATFVEKNETHFALNLIVLVTINEMWGTHQNCFILFQMKLKHVFSISVSKFPVLLTNSLLLFPYYFLL